MLVFRTAFHTFLSDRSRVSLSRDYKKMDPPCDSRTASVQWVSALFAAKSLHPHSARPSRSKECLSVGLEARPPNPTPLLLLLRRLTLKVKIG